MDNQIATLSIYASIGLPLTTEYTILHLLLSPFSNKTWAVQHVNTIKYNQHIFRYMGVWRQYLLHLMYIYIYVPYVSNKLEIVQNSGDVIGHDISRSYVKLLIVTWDYCYAEQNNIGEKHATNMTSNLSISQINIFHHKNNWNMVSGSISLNIYIHHNSNTIS